MIDTLLILFLMVLALAGYALPTIVAWQRKHHQATAIFVLNMFAGWSGVCWVIALVWSFTAVRNDTQSLPEVSP